MTSSWDAVSRDDLLRWADDEGSPARLPELLRRLVLETADEVEAIDIPGGGGVTTGGFDGHVRAARPTAFVPAGSSVWELSVRKTRPSAKADEDYEKRLETPDGSPTAETTYVEVIARPWKDAATWAARRSTEGRWRHVRGHNVDWLTTWLEQGPATRLWFLDLIGRGPLGATTADRWWDRWASATKPRLTPDVVLSRAEGGVSALDRYMRERGLTTVSGPLGGDELAACAVAAAVRANDDMLARAVVVHEVAAMRRLLAERSRLMLILRDPALANEVDGDTVHSVIVPVPLGDRADVMLEPIDTAAVVEAIRTVDAEAPSELGSLARRSFPALRRRLALRRELMTPVWATGTVSPAVRAALLLTSWHDGSVADQEVLAALAGVRYQDVREEFRQFSVGDDPLFAVTDQHWHIVSPVDAWLLLGRHLLRDDVERLCGKAVQVLAEVDPALSLPREDRWRASMEGKVLRHSQSLRAGVAASLALLATYGDTVVSGTGTHGERWVAGVVHRLLHAANDHGSLDLWESLAPQLPLLAEAAPSQFIDAIRVGVAGPVPILAGIFKDDPNENDVLGPGSPHRHFLWALETLAWSPQHLGAVAELLAFLANMDPGGRLSNRPTSSLYSIFCAWHPETAADEDQRLRVLDRLRERWPNVAWRLTVDLLPSNRSIHMPTHSPEVRDWKPSRVRVTRADHWQMVEQLVTRALSDVGVDTDRWIELLEAHHHLPPEARSRVQETLNALDPASLPEQSRQGVWQALRQSVARHREYGDAEWALPADEVDRLDVLATKFASPRPELRHGWLFVNDWVDLGDLQRRDDHDAYDQELARRRAEAVSEIWAEGGLEAVVDFARSHRVSVVGVGLADSVGDAHVDVVVGWLSDEGDSTKQGLANAYVWKLCRSRGLPWALDLLGRHHGLPAKAQAAVLLCVPDYMAAANIASTRHTDVEREFWRGFSYLGRGVDFPHVMFVAEKLMWAQRWAGALDLLSLYAHRNAVDDEYAHAVTSAFEGLIKEGVDETEGRALATWDFERLFQILDQHVEEIGVDRVTRIQWYFLPALGFDPPTNSLHRRLAEDPAFFDEIICLVYRARNSDRSLDGVGGQDEGREAVARNAYILLDSWRLPPGTSFNGDFDVERCEAWIHEAVELLEASDRAEVGKKHIGWVLAHATHGPDGWPSDEVAGLIGRLDDDDIEVGLRMRVRNERGVTSRSLDEGGDQERALAAQYRAAAHRFLASEPRVAALLNSLADDYEDEARYHDADAERHRRGLDP